MRSNRRNRDGAIRVINQFGIVSDFVPKINKRGKMVIPDGLRIAGDDEARSFDEEVAKHAAQLAAQEAKRDVATATKAAAALTNAIAVLPPAAPVTPVAQTEPPATEESTDAAGEGSADRPVRKVFGKPVPAAQ